jgi:hypothetical protein
MAIRGFILTASLAVVPAALAGCGQDPPTATETVRLAVIAGAEHGGAPFSTRLTQEVTTVPVFAGDPDGTGVALITVNRGQREVCWDVSVSDIQLPATASHIHRAPPGVRGDIVVGLTPPDGTGRAVGCASGLNPDLLRDLKQNPEFFYVNVHTIPFPAGAVRGQLGG